MKFTLLIHMNSAAFKDQGNGDPSYETARILRDVAKRIEGHPHFSPGHSQPVRDINGNHVGDFDVLD